MPSPTAPDVLTLTSLPFSGAELAVALVAATLPALGSAPPSKDCAAAEPGLKASICRATKAAAARPTENRRRYGSPIQHDTHFIVIFSLPLSCDSRTPCW